jgi:rhomboid family GlyGly-CTERM serine protease
VAVKSKVANSSAPASVPASARAPGVPWATLAVALLALGVWLWPGAQTLLAYERDRVLAGEWWRLITAHVVHWSGSHLGWNLVVFLLTGVWAERLSPARTRWFLAVAPGVIGATLLAGDPALAHYAGLSGVVAGMVALLALTQLSAAGTDVWFWRGVFALLLLKIIAELLVDHPLFARVGEISFKPVPLAHLAGLVCAWIVHRSRRR